MANTRRTEIANDPVWWAVGALPSEVVITTPCLKIAALEGCLLCRVRLSLEREGCVEADLCPKHYPGNQN